MLTEVKVTIRSWNMKLLPLNYLWGPTLGSLTSRYETSYKSEKPDNWHFKLPLPLLAPSCAQRLATLSYAFAQSFSFNHLQAKSTCLKKRSKHRNSGRIPSLIGSLTPHTVDYYTSNLFCNLARHLQNSQCSLALHWIELKGSTTVSDALGLGTTL